MSDALQLTNQPDQNTTTFL